MATGMIKTLKEFRAMIGLVGFILVAGISTGGVYYGDYVPLKQNVSENTCSRVWGKVHRETEWLRSAKAEAELEKIQRRRISPKLKQELDRAHSNADAAYYKAIKSCPQWARQSATR